jgi:hypothetical protein
MADTPSTDKPPKEKKAKKEKKKKKGEDGGAKAGTSVATHPRARQAVRRAKGFGGLAGFALAALLSHSAGLAVTGVLERALIAGVAGYLLAWACAVTVWRHLVLAEIRTALERQRQLVGERRAIPLGAREPDASPETPATAPAPAPVAPSAG